MGRQSWGLGLVVLVLAGAGLGSAEEPVAQPVTPPSPPSDPNESRLMFAPTGRPLGKGNGYFSDHYVLFPGVGVRPDEEPERRGRHLDASGRGPDGSGLLRHGVLRLRLGGNSAIAVGGFLAGARAYEVADFGVAALYGVGTLGPPDRSLSLGIAAVAVQEEEYHFGTQGEYRENRAPVAVPRRAGADARRQPAARPQPLADQRELAAARRRLRPVAAALRARAALLQRTPVRGRGRDPRGRGSRRGLPRPVAFVLLSLRPVAAAPRAAALARQRRPWREPSRRGDDNAAMRFALLAAAAIAVPAVAAPLEPFPLRDVRLLDGPFLEMQRRGLETLLSFDPDRLLHTFRVNAGLPDERQALRRLGSAEGGAARPQPRPLPDGLRAGMGGDGRRSAQGARAPGRGGAPEGPARARREGSDPGLPVGVPRRVLRSRGRAPRRVGAVLHAAQDPRRPAGRAPRVRRPHRARDREGHGRVGRLARQAALRRSVAGDAADRVRRDAGIADRPLRRHEGRRAPAPRAPLRPPRGLRPARARRGRARRPARQHPDPEGDRRGARLRAHGRGPLLPGGGDVLEPRRERALLRDRRPQRGRALLSRQALLAPPRRVDGRDLQHLQHAQALARALPARPSARAHRLLRARPLQPHPRVERPGERRSDLLRPDEAGRLAHLLDARGLVLVLRRHRHGKPVALRRGDLRALRGRALRQPVPRVRARAGASRASGCGR